ncbi:unnamed protein product, partial [Vitis vinifera]|uniref:Uncharacterized protein n=1 Tax=Vitis vinifera TaxID=29760 RepID=D7TEU9_VITVI
MSLKEGCGKLPPRSNIKEISGAILDTKKYALQVCHNQGIYIDIPVISHWTVTRRRACNSI